MAADLHLDQEAFRQAKRDLQRECTELEELKKNLEQSFAQLKKDWDSDAGRAFFARFEKDLLENLKRYAAVFAHMSENVQAASERYEEVFDAADTVADAQF